MSNIVIVDNSSSKCTLQARNLVPIRDFTGEEGDDELESLLSYLLTFKKTKDVRVKIETDFRK